MRNIFKKVAAVAGLCFAMLLAVPAVANAYSQEDINRISSTFQSGNMVVDQYGVVSNASNVNAALKPLNVGVAVVDFGGRSSGSGMDAATRIKDMSGLATVAVFSSDSPRAAYVYGDNAEAFATVVNTAIGEGASVGDALVKGADALTDANVQAQNTEKENGIAAFFKGLLIVVLVIVFLVFALITAAVLVVKKRLKAAKKAKEIHVESINEGIDAKVARLNELKPLYPKVGPVNQEIIGELMTHINVLFKRLREEDNRSQLKVAEAEYDFKLGELVRALEENYYLSILATPLYWSEPDRRIEEVANAVANVNEEVLVNIRKANSSNDLEFSVVLEMLSRSLEKVDPFSNEKE